MKSCLLIISKHFYSFNKYISQALESKGYEVIVANDEYPEGVLGRIMGKLQIPLIFYVTEKVFDEQFIGGRHYDLVLIFKGRGMTPRLIEKLRQVSDRVVGYNWDSFRLNRSPLRWLKYTSKYYTFDYRDAERHGLPMVELFSSSHPLDEKKAVYEVSAIVRNHGQRLAYIDRALSILKPESVFISVFEHSVVTLALNFIQNPALYIKYWKYISFKSLPYAKYTQVLSDSVFTIDFAHETQTGITMRCFEAINAKTKIITNIPYIKRSVCFNEQDYIVFEDFGQPDDLLNDYRKKLDQPFVSSPRHITHFIDDLLA